MSKLLALALVFAISGAAWAQRGEGWDNKFGFNSDVDDVEETVWVGADLSGPARAIFDTTAFTLYASSDNAADTMAIRVVGLDANYDDVSVDVTLAGLTFTQVGTASNWIRVHRAYNISSTAVTGDVYLHIDPTDGNADGIPDTPATDIRGALRAGLDQTQLGYRTVPRGMQGAIRGWCMDALATGGGSNNITGRLRAMAEGQVSRIQGRLSVQNPGHSCIYYDPPRVYPAKTTIEVTAVSTASNANVDVGTDIMWSLLPATDRFER